MTHFAWLWIRRTDSPEQWEFKAANDKAALRIARNLARKRRAVLVQAVNTKTGTEIR